MATTTHISFLFKASTLPRGGTYDQPATHHGQGHGQIRVFRDGHLTTSSPVSGDTPVQVPRQSEVTISFDDLDGNPAVVMAPARMLVHSWKNETGKERLLELLTDSSTKPIDTPQFNVKPMRDCCTLAYHPGQPIWRKEDEPAFDWWHSVGIGNSVDVSSNSVNRTFISFNTQSHVGMLDYGLEFRVVRAGTDLGYFWFDPFLTIE